MTDLFKLKLPNQQSLSSLLGLALDGSRLEGVVLRRTNGSLQVQQSFSVALSLDPLTNDPLLVGREIRNHLEAAGIRERRCVFGLPLQWALVVHAKVPELPESDVASYLDVEAERSFPCDLSTLLMATSLYSLPGGETQATMIGVPRNYITLLEQVLHAAQLKVLSFSLGITALQPVASENSNGVMALAIQESQVGLQITICGGVVALRALEAHENGQPELNAEAVSREARIILGQCEYRQAVRRVRIFGPKEMARELAEEMQLRLQPMGLKVEVVSKFDQGEFGLHLPLDMPVSPACSLAAARLAGEKPVFEFLPPKVRPWQKFIARYSSGLIQKAAIIVVVLLLVPVALFGYQQWQLLQLRSEWMQMAQKAHDLDVIQGNIRKFRPWFDESIRSLSILRQITEAFPEDGVVSAKSVEIRDQYVVTCAGITRDNQELLKTMERLRAAPTVSDFKMGPIRGKAPMQFTFDFHWVDGREK
jgi:hypothetical protein